MATPFSAAAKASARAHASKPVSLGFSRATSSWSSLRARVPSASPPKARSGALPSTARASIGPPRRSRLFAIGCVRLPGAAGAARWPTGCANSTSTSAAGYRTVGSPSTTARSPHSLPGGGAAGAGASGSRGAPCAPKSESYSTWGPPSKRRSSRPGVLKVRGSCRGRGRPRPA